ncbi:MAG: hypothetical protein CL886_07170 [Dehalococcoidia bacterium]|mgnify:CR=1 FL=1|nr:hypothetical protein [Dehalococcoidia bacterium]
MEPSKLKDYQYYPSSPQEQWLESPGMRLHYLKWNEGKKPLIGLHGLASSAQWYTRLSKYLTDFSLIAPDQRGHGKSSQSNTGYDWATMSTDIINLLNHNNLQNIPLIGHSWGGHVASNISALFPDRVSHLIMVDGGFQDGHLLPNPSWEGFRSRFSPRDVSGKRKDFIEKMRYQLRDCWDTDLEETVLSMVYEDDEGEIRDILHPDNHRQILQTMWDTPPSVTLSQIQCPTLIVAAGPQSDRANTEFARLREIMVSAAESIIPTCEVTWIPDTIHDIGYHKPDLLASIIEDFIRNN